MGEDGEIREHRRRREDGEHREHRRREDGEHREHRRREGGEHRRREDGEIREHRERRRREKAEQREGATSRGEGASSRLEGEPGMDEEDVLQVDSTRSGLRVEHRRRRRREEEAPTSPPPPAEERRRKKMSRNVSEQQVQLMNGVSIPETEVEAGLFQSLMDMGRVKLRRNGERRRSTKVR